MNGKRYASYDYYNSFIDSKEGHNATVKLLLLPIIRSLLVGCKEILPLDEYKLDFSRKFQFAERFWVSEFLVGDLGFYVLAPNMSEGISFLLVGWHVCVSAKDGEGREREKCQLFHPS